MSLHLNNALVLLGAQNPENKAVSTFLESRKINMIRMEPGAVQRHIVVERTQPNYAFYVGHLAAYMEAVEGSKVNVSYAAFPLDVDDAELLPLTFPKLIVDFNKPVPEENWEMLDMELGQGGREVQVIRKKPVHLIKIKALSNFRDVKNLGDYNPITPAVADTCNIAAFSGYVIALRIASRFLKLHYYPAFHDPDHLENFDKWEEKGDGEDDGIRHEMDTSAEGGVVSTSAQDKGKGKDVEFDLFSLEIETNKKYAVPPQRSEPVTYISEVDDLPPYSGVYSPYYSQLAHNDCHLVPDIINRYFKRNLGENVDEILEQMSKLKSAWGIVGNTEAGKSLSHLYFFIEAAIEAQARVIPVIRKGFYVGSFLCGYGFTMNIGGIEKVPQANYDLIKGFRLANPHDVSIEELLDLLEVEGEEEEWRDAQTGGHLHLLAQNVAIAPNKVNRVKRLLDQLHLPQRHWPYSGPHIIKAFQLLNQSGPLDKDLPILPRLAFSTDRVELVLSCFGEFAPSFKIEGGRKVSLEGALKAEIRVPGKGKTGKVEVEVGKICCRAIPLKDAVDDMAWIRKEASIQTPFAQSNMKSSQKNMSRSFSGQEAAEIVVELKKWSHVGEIAGPSAPKRKSGGGGGGSSKKKKGLTDI